MTAQAGNSKFVKTMNRQNILNLIRLSEEISRSELVQQTGLTAPTVSDITKRFMHKGLIVESGIAKSTGGRRAVTFRLNPEARYSVGLDVENGHVGVQILDFTGETVFQADFPYQGEVDFSELLGLLENAVLHAIRESGIEREKVLGIGVSVPGLVNMDTGEVHLIPHFHLRNVLLKEKLEDVLQLPVSVINDANAAALAEKWLGQARDNENFICVVGRTGIGAGLFLGGELYQGSAGVAGEIGHQTVEIDGPLCDCGNYGCLESLAGSQAILKYVKAQLKQGRKSMLTELVEDFEALTLDNVCHAASLGDQLALDVFNRTGVYLGLGLANIINILNPEKLLISGDILKYRDYLDRMHETLDSKLLGVQKRCCQVAYSEMGVNSSGRGAGVLVLDRFRV